ncbi:uncharacterized protein LOC110460978 [Mizuhopecten yessoensis]|uniref:CUB domain-containing protein n=1 Tax=Mizuhopecten yessoensis TaxID=6573 RepID=A0A210Q199_MIZYE|nr:uncharacterized protein LOC110460978 [Mizuhopecten yessoensis]OWF42502.1 hypothetical protein KP79_PYT11082 [Mizuhopecten yessoensis]
MPRSRWDLLLLQLMAASLFSPVIAFNVKNIYMDSIASCNSRHTIYDFDIVLGGHDSVASSNPPTTCQVIIEAGYTDTYFMLEIIQEAITISDCSFSLNIYNGEGTVGVPLKSLSCGSKSTGVLYTKGRIATFYLRQPRDIFQPKNDFSLRIKAFRDPNAPEVVEGISHLPVGAIVGIVLALVLLIAFIILLCWCFKNGKLPGMDGRPYKQRPKRKPQDRSESGTVNSAFSEKKVSMNPSRNNNFNLNNQDLWDTMTNASQSSMASLTTGQPTGKNYNKNMISRDGTNGTGRPRRGQYSVSNDSAVLAGNLAKNANNGAIATSQETDVDQMYENYDKPAASSTVSRPGRQRKPQESNETETKRPKSGRFETPDEENKEATEEKPTGILAELQKELSRRKSMKEGKETDINDTAPGGPSSKRRGPGVKALLPEEMDSLEDTKFMALDQQSEPLESDKMSNPMLSSSNPAIRASVNELRPRTEGSPRSKKKKRKRKKSINDSGPRRHRNAPDTGDEYEPDHPTGYTTEEPMELLSRIPLSDPLSSLPLPPEALAPVFATDTSTQPHYYSQPDQYGYQPQPADQYSQPQIIGYDGYGNPVYGYNNQAPGGVGGAPYGQAGQPTYYMQPDGQVVMIPAPGMEGQPYNQGLQITDMGSPGAPGYASTPSNHDPNSRHRSPRHGRKSKPMGLMATVPGGPTGTVLDDPNLPPPGTTMMRTGIDPVSGAQVNQVVWSDLNRDPTDPVGVDNPQITRKTMVRVTTKANEGGGVPDAPSPALQQMSFNAAQQLKTGAEPAFMSPSKGRVQGGALPYMTPAPIYAAETPERDNTGFYTGVNPTVRDTPHVPPSGPGGPRVHNAPRANNAFRDKITLSMADESEI